MSSAMIRRPSSVLEVDRHRFPQQPGTKKAAAEHSLCLRENISTNCQEKLVSYLFRASDRSNWSQTMDSRRDWAQARSNVRPSLRIQRMNGGRSGWALHLLRSPAAFQLEGGQVIPRLRRTGHPANHRRRCLSTSGSGRRESSPLASKAVRLVIGKVL